MGLSLLAPGVLLLGALVALPVLAHLARQVPRDRQPFGAMLLLQRVVKRLRRRRRLKDPFLLLLRALAVLGAVLAVAGPQWVTTGVATELGASGRVVIILDRSLSMGLVDGGSTLLQRARAEAASTVRDLPDGTLVGVVAFDTTAQRLTPALTADHRAALARIEELQPSYGGSDLRGALLEARRLLGGEAGEVLVFTDEAGPRLVADAHNEIRLLLESEAVLVPRPVHARPPRNVAVVSASYGDGIEGGQITFRVANYGPNPIEVPCEVSLPDGQEIPVFVDLPPEGEAEGRVTVPTEARGGVGRAWCEDRDLPADAARYFHLPRVGASRVLVVDGAPGDTPTRSEVYFLERALAPWGAQRGGVRPDVTTPLGLADLDPEQHRVVFLANVSDPRPYGPRLTEFVRRGGSLVISAGSNVTADRYNAALGSVLPAPIRQPQTLAAPDEDGVPLALPDADHPLFTPFARAGRSSFGRVRTHRVVTLEPYEDSDEVATLLRYQGGLPALVERRVGAGRVLVWTSSIDFAWTNLPLQAVFMPLVQRKVSWLGGEAGGAEGRFTAVVGERVAIPLPESAIEPDVVGPDGQVVRSRLEDGHVHFVPDRPGAWQLRLDEGSPLAWIAVNTPPEESDVRRYDSLAAAGAEIAPEVYRRHIDLSSAFFGGALLLLALQGLIGLRGSA